MPTRNLQPIQPQERLLTTREAAARLKRSYKTAWGIMRSHGFREPDEHYGHWRITEEALQRAVEERKRREKAPRAWTKIRARRKELGWSQYKLALKTGRTQVFISQIEGGKENPGPETLRRLARALGCEVRDLMEDPKGPEGTKEETEARDHGQTAQQDPGPA